jgi:hypothetical protein
MNRILLKNKHRPKFNIFQKSRANLHLSEKIQPKAEMSTSNARKGKASTSSNKASTSLQQNFNVISNKKKLKQHNQLRKPL